MEKNNEEAAVVIVAIVAFTALMTFIFLAGGQSQSSMRVDSFDAVNNQITVENTGTSTLKDFSVSVDGGAVSATGDPIAPGDTGYVSINEPLSAGDHILIVSSGNAQSVYDINVPDMWYADITVS